MKLKLLSTIACLFVAFFFYFNIEAGAAIIETKTVEEVAAENIQLQAIADEVGPGNFQGLSNWLSSHIKYKEDRTAADEWKEPHTTLKDGTGDCEDYAILALEVLKRMGVQDVFLLGVSRKSRSLGHVVAFFRVSKDQKWQYYDFEKLKMGTQTFEDLKYAVARECRYGSNIEYQLADRDRKNLPPVDEAKWGLDK